jgi:adenylylsulfate kinase-like enzyme
MYAQARRGTIRGVVGVDEDFEVPKDANLTVDITRHSISEIVHGTSFSELFFNECSSVVGIVLLLETSGLL